MSNRAAITPSVCYRDPLAAMTWLERTFGFEPTVIVTDADGNATHLEMGFRGGALYIAGEWDGPPLAPARSKSPASLDGCLTSLMRIHLDEGLDAHCAHARAAGARIIQEPEDQFYGDRIYRVLDPEGHLWTFSQPVRQVPVADQQAATGLTIRTKEAAS